MCFEPRCEGGGEGVDEMETHDGERVGVGEAAEGVAEVAFLLPVLEGEEEDRDERN